MVFMLFIFVVLSTQVVHVSSCNFMYANDYILFNKRLTAHDFFNLTTRDLLKCAQQCMRRTRCISFNYDQTGRICVLNRGAWTGGTKLIDAQKWLYSAILDWPLHTDPDCYGRHCGVDEYCMPLPRVMLGTTTTTTSQATTNPTSTPGPTTTAGPLITTNNILFNNPHPTTATTPSYICTVAEDIVF